MIGILLYQYFCKAVIVTDVTANKQCRMLLSTVITNAMIHKLQWYLDPVR